MTNKIKPLKQGYSEETWHESLKIIGRGNINNAIKFADMQHNQIHLELNKFMQKYFSKAYKSKRKRGISFHINQQTGKTHLLFALILRAVNVGKSVLYYTAKDFARDVIADNALIRDGNLKQYEMRAKYVEYDVVILDDLNIHNNGRFAMTDPQLAILAEYLDKWVNRKAWVFIASNNAISDFKNVSDHIEVGRIYERMKQNLKIMQLELPVWNKK